MKTTNPQIIDELLTKIAANILANHKYAVCGDYTKTECVVDIYQSPRVDIEVLAETLHLDFTVTARAILHVPTLLVDGFVILDAWKSNGILRVKYAYQNGTYRPVIADGPFGIFSC